MNATHATALTIEWSLTSEDSSWAMCDRHNCDGSLHCHPPQEIAASRDNLGLDSLWLDDFGCAC